MGQSIEHLVRQVGPVKQYFGADLSAFHTRVKSTLERKTKDGVPLRDKILSGNMEDESVRKAVFDFLGEQVSVVSTNSSTTLKKGPTRSSKFFGKMKNHILFLCYQNS